MSSTVSKTARVTIQKITGPDDMEMTGFVIVDLVGATTADGIVRCAKKVLMDGARTMARSRTYGWATIGERRSGASAGINVAPGDRSAGVAAFVAAVLPSVAAGELSLDAGKGILEGELDRLAAVDHRDGTRTTPGSGALPAVRLDAVSVLAATSRTLGGLEGRTVAIEGPAVLGSAVASRLAAAGASVVAVGTAAGTVNTATGLDPADVADLWAEHGDSLPTALGSTLAPAEILCQSADVLMCGSRLGVIDHEVAAGLDVAVVSPIGVAPVTAKGLAVAQRNGTVVLPDFLTLSGALHSFVSSEGADLVELEHHVEDQTSSLADAALDHDDGVYLGACEIAERFLAGWVDEMPFGRPLA